MTYNDGYKLKEWIAHYNEYRSELDYYIIVDNGSEKEYVDTLYKSFPDAIIIERETNGGCTAAYNDGIKYVIEKTDADNIIIIGNDVRLAEGCIGVLSRFLESDSKIGIVTAAVLHIASDKVDCFGVSEGYFGSHLCENGKTYDEIKGIEKETDLYGGGFYMFPRKLCEDVGYQDNKLFMYSDEIDMAIRTRKAGYRICTTSNTYAWHWHINQPGCNNRKPASKYLVARNRVYIAKKHYSKSKVIVYFFYYTAYLPLKWLLRRLVRGKKAGRFSSMLNDSFYSFMGGWNGILGNMNHNRFMVF